jgi:ribonuclease P protein component
MVSGRACVRGPAAPSSSGGVARAGSGSRPKGRSYSSLRGRSEIRSLRRRGTRRRVGGVTVIAAPGEPGPPRVAVVAGRQVGSAVRRNRAKRRLREAAARAPIRRGHDYMLVASRAVLDARFDEVVEWVHRAVRSEER